MDAPVALTVEVPRVLTAKELAALLGVSRMTFYRWQKAGALPRPLATPGAPRWSAAVVQKWLERGGRG